MARVKKEKVKKEKKEKGEKKKGGKKKLLVLFLGLILLAAVAAVVVLFVLPKFFGEQDETEKEPPKGLQTYEVGEDTAAALDTILEEGEGRLIAHRGPEKPKGDESQPQDRHTYIYEMESYAAVMDRYLDLMMGEEQGFVLVDEEYLHLQERPELVDEEGALILARASVLEGNVFQLVIGWSQSSGTLAVRVSTAEGGIHEPKNDTAPPVIAATVQEQLDTLNAMEPSQLTLSGSSMSEYDIYPVEGFVRIDEYYCRRFNIYAAGESGDIVAIIFLSGDQKHVFRMDVNDNTIITALW
ncbi:MAG: hypothetical protein HFF52_07780 [Lawsonibacter sp.]|nr:hypothetical protein [Lawsonibacter sp.]